MSLQDLSNLSYFIVPFANLRGKDANWTDPVLIVVSVLWTSTVVLTGIKLGDNLPIDDISILSGVLGGTLGFLLPLYLSDCISKNRTGVGLYETYCGDVIALAWEVAAYGDGVKALKGENVKEQLEADLSQSNDEEPWTTLRKELFQIMREMPMVIKHVFRKDFEYDQIKDYELATWMQRIKIGKDNPIEEVMFLLVMRLRRIPVVTSGNGAILSIMMKKWNDIYVSYGNTGSLILYQEPLLFSYVLYTAMAFFIAILPFSFSDTENFHNVWLAGLVVYFLLSLNAAGRLIQSPFAEVNDNSNVYATVSETSRSTVVILDRIRDYGDSNWNKARKQYKRINY
jgi:predicted membrane chloride channel (bestrophin family)